MMKKTAGIVALTLMVSLTLAPALAFAAPQDVGGGNTGGPQDVGGGNSANQNVNTAANNFPTIDSADKVIKILDNITNWMFTVFMVLAVIFILLAAYKYLFSGGGEEVAKAHKMILYSAVAVAVAILARGIVHIVASLLTV